jgi:glucose/arabinose dehydrogenase
LTRSIPASLSVRRVTQLSLLTWAFQALSAAAATVPSGFAESLVASGLSSPTAMQFAPDGRLFVCEQGGRLRVIKNGALLPDPFLTVTVNRAGERGLLGVAFDPNFASNRHVYVYYTATSPAVHNRISRFTASTSNPDVAASGSEVAVLDLENLSATNHNGGAIAFGPDGKLYVAVGENAVAYTAQTLTNRLGKMLRINPDGSIPSDNPFFAIATGANRAIWALGLRNPFTFAFNRGGTELFINDVGRGTWEEINEGAAGANYGWPDTEGPTTNPNFTTPRYAYGHSSGTCAITGGAFYSPLTITFPSDYVGDYFFADYCAGWIRKLDLATGGVMASFATGIASPVDLKVGDDGHLYYLARGSEATSGVVYRVEYRGTLPSITTHPTSPTVPPGASVTFSVRASGAPPLRYQWQRNGVNIPNATVQDFTISSVTASDNGARFRATVSNDSGNAFSNEAVLTVTTNRVPTATISQPAAGTLYSGGAVISYAGTGTDPDDGTLPASAFTWRVDFHHDTHTHPFIPPRTGVRNGTFTIPTTGHMEANVWYRVHLTVRDSGGLTHTTQRDVQPRKVRLTLATVPTGLSLRLNGQPVATPHSFDSVVGILHTLEAGSPQARGGTTYELVSWSDGGPPRHDISTPGANRTYTASYRTRGGSPPVPPPTPPPSPPPSPPPPAGPGLTLTAYPNGLSVHLTWSVVGGATSYRLEAGTGTSMADVFSGDVGNVTQLDTQARAGTYFARIKAMTAQGGIATSNEVSFTLAGPGPCATPPPAPAGYTAQAWGLSAFLSWNAAPTATSYVLEAGLAPGHAAYRANLGSGVTFGASAPAGTYFTRIRAINACGASDPSNEVQLTLQCTGVPSPPANLRFVKNGSSLTLLWDASRGATTYRLQAGTAPGRSDAFDADLGGATTQHADVSRFAGTWFVRIVANSTCGRSVPSNEVVISLP